MRPRIALITAVRDEIIQLPYDYCGRTDAEQTLFGSKIKIVEPPPLLAKTG